MNAPQLTPRKIYELVSKVGFRKYFHFGGLTATLSLIEAAHIQRGQSILDIGCATGKTACYLAKHYDCQVTGIDINPRMIQQAYLRAIEEGVSERVQFLAADALHLPFSDNSFDIVIGEFITGLLVDKHQAVAEYCRVVRPSGYVALNEATLLKAPIPEQLADYLSHSVGLEGELYSAEQWQALLQTHGLTDVSFSVSRVKDLKDKKEDIKDLLRTWHRVFYYYLFNREFRYFIHQAVRAPKSLLAFLGYGIYRGQKP